MYTFTLYEYTCKLHERSSISVNFRVYAIQPNLLPVDSGTVDVFVKVIPSFSVRFPLVCRSLLITEVNCLFLQDPGGRILRRWLRKQLLNGECFLKEYLHKPVCTCTYTSPVYMYYMHTCTCIYSHYSVT